MWNSTREGGPELASVQLPQGGVPLLPLPLPRGGVGRGGICDPDADTGSPLAIELPEEGAGVVDREVGVARGGVGGSGGITCSSSSGEAACAADFPSRVRLNVGELLNASAPQSFSSDCQLDLTPVHHWLSKSSCSLHMCVPFAHSPNFHLIM